MQRTSPQKQLKRRNDSILLNAIRRHAPVSRTALAELTGLSAQTVTNVVRRLLEDGLLVETGAERGGSLGRHPISLELRPEGACAIGFCLERDSLAKAVVDFTGKVMRFERDPLPPGETPERTTARMIDFARGVLDGAERGDIGGRIAGVGVGVPGPIDHAAGAVLSPPNYPGWERVPLREELRQALGCPVVFGNSSTVAAIGEHWQGKWNADSFLYCYWGMGIGGGLVTGDRIYRGQSGNAIELGHTIVESNGRLCECGGRGCLEAYAAIPSLLKEAAAYGRFEDFGQLLDAAKPGTAPYRIVARAADYLAQSLVTAVNLLDIDLIVLGGEHIRRVEPLFVPVIADVLRARALRSKVAEVRVEVSTLAAEAGAIGAASLVFHDTLLSY